jgi:hypothetical protein
LPPAPNNTVLWRGDGYIDELFSGDSVFCNPAAAGKGYIVVRPTITGQRETIYCDSATLCNVYGLCGSATASLYNAAGVCNTAESIVIPHRIDYNFRSPFALPAGNYRIRITIDMKNDLDSTNNVVITPFTINPSLEGDFTIPGRFDNIESALEAVYTQGVGEKGVTFILTERKYDIGS